MRTGARREKYCVMGFSRGIEKKRHWINMKIKLLPAESEKKSTARVKIIRNPSRSDAMTPSISLFFSLFFSLLARRSLPFSQFMCLFLPASLSRPAPPPIPLPPPSFVASRRVAPASDRHSQDAFYSSSVCKSWHRTIFVQIEFRWRPR